MTLKPKTVRRLFLLGVVSVLVIGGGLAILVARQWQGRRLESRLREEGFAAFDREDHAQALDRLGRYLKRQGETPEPDALLRYARSRARVEEADGHHLSEAIGVYRRYLSIRPDDRDAAIELLRLYSAAGLFPEARDAASRLRPAHPEEWSPEDLPVLREEVRALVGMGGDDPHLGVVALAITTLSPLELDAQLTYCDWLVRQKQAAEARKFAADAVAARPADPRARLLELLVGVGEPTGAEINRLYEGVRALAGLDPDDPAVVPTGEFPDEAYALRVAALLDQIGQHDDAVAVLRAVATREDMPAARRFAARRTWQAGRPAWTLESTEGLRPGDLTCPADLLGFRALALRETGRQPEADEIRDALGAREGDYRARGWAEAMAAPALDAQTGRQAADAFGAAMAAFPQEPVFRYFHAECLAAVGRSEDAIAEWQAVARSPLSIGWAQPWARMAQASLDLGLVREAADYAERAGQIAPRSAAVATVRFAALVARVERSSTPTGDEAALLRFAERADEEAGAIPDAAVAARFRESLLPGRVLLLARTGRRPDAIAQVERCLREPPPPSRETLERLAIISIREGLDHDEPLLDFCVRVHGEAASTAGVRALAMHTRGQDDAARRMLEDRLREASGDEQVAWQMTRAAFLDQISDPGASAAWVAIADAHPGNLAVQSAALRSPSAARDAEFIERAARRIASLTGDADPRSSVVRLARARALLSGRPTARQHDEAVGLIRAVTVDQPRLVEAHVLLADALLAEDEGAGIRPDIPGALAALRAAAGASVDPAPLWLRVAECLQRQRDFAGARQELLKLSHDAREDTETQRRAAELLVAQGAVLDAIPIYESVTARWPDAGVRLALAEAYALARRDADALAAFRRIVDESAVRTPEEAVAVAIWLHRLRDEPAARRALSALRELPGTEAARELHQARYQAECGDVTAAEQGLRNAIALEPANTDARVLLIALLTRQNRLQDAAAAIREARQALPQEPTLLVLETQIAASGGSGGTGLAAFADAIAASPGSAETARAVRAVAEAAQSGRLDTEQGLVALSDRFPGSLPVQNLVVRRLMELTPPQPRTAVRVAEHTMASFPRAPEPARLAFAIYTHLQEWDRAMTAAEAWRRRDPTRSLAADAAVAQVHLAQGSADRALQVLQPRLEAARAAAGSAEADAVLGIAARANVALGRHEEAWTMLAPALAASHALRIETLLPLAAEMESTEAAKGWLDRASSLFPTDDVLGRARLASAYARLALRSDPPASPLVDSAESVLAAVPAGSSEDPGVLLAKGLVAQARGDLNAAADAYRQALGFESARIEALDRIASLAGPGIDLTASVRAADEAVRGSDDPATLILLARVHQAIGEHTEGPAGASSLRRALELLRRALQGAPDNVEALIRAASIADGLEDTSAAIDLYLRALDQPGTPEEARAVIQNNAAYLLLRSSRGNDDLRRARSLADAAVASSRRVPFLDTLARVELALENRARAEALFREALKADPNHAGARLGLVAMLLDQGGHAEALRMLEDGADLRASGVIQVSSEQARIWDDLRARAAAGK